MPDKFEEMALAEFESVTDNIQLAALLRRVDREARDEIAGNIRNLGQSIRDLQMPDSVVVSASLFDVADEITTRGTNP